MACEPLAPSFEHGILSRKGMTAFSHCSASGSAATDVPTYERCLSCVGADENTKYLYNCKPAVHHAVYPSVTSC